MQPLLNTITIHFSSPHSRWLLRTLALPLLMIWFSQVSTVVGQDLNSMPWMDQDSGEIAPVGIEKRAPSLTRDRSEIPLKPVKKQAPATNTAPGGTPSTSAGLSAFATILVYSLIGAGVGLLIGVVVWLIMTARIDVDSDTVSSRSDRTLAESIRHLPFEMDVKQGDFRQQAQAAYQAGDFRKALVFLFSHVLVTLDQAKLVRLKKGKTNRQYLRELSPSRPLVKYYGDVMVPFEQTFFGDYPITKDVFEDCWQGLEGFQSSVDAARSKTSRSESVLSNIVHANAVVGTSVAGGQGIDV